MALFLIDDLVDHLFFLHNGSQFKEVKQGLFFEAQRKVDGVGHGLQMVHGRERLALSQEELGFHKSTHIIGNLSPLHRFRAVLGDQVLQFGEGLFMDLFLFCQRGKELDHAVVLLEFFADRSIELVPELFRLDRHLHDLVDRIIVHALSLFL